MAEKSLIDVGLAKKYIEMSGDGKKITYVSQNKTYQFTDPEEKVRADYYVELIEKYQYSPKKINLEIQVPRKTSNDSADLVIFEDDAQQKPYIVIECKKDGVTDAEFEQAIEQALDHTNSLTACYTGVVAGKTRRFFSLQKDPQAKRNKNTLADIPINFGKIQEFKFKKGDKDWDIKPVRKNDLIRILSKCGDTLWDGGKIAPIDAFDELSKIIFVKIRDEQMTRKKGEPYNFQMKTQETPESVYSRIINLYNDAKILAPEVFIESLKSPPSKLFNVVNHLQGVNLSKTDLDTKGVAFERLMENFFKGKQGQYFTPREIVHFILDLCDFDPTSKILDPACGSGGFLLHALDSVREKAGEYYEEGSAEYWKFWHDFAANNLFGIEVNERIARVAQMNMVIHDAVPTNVICSDALERWTKIQSINRQFQKNTFDLILTNPPFGTSVKKEEKPYLDQFILGKNNGKKNRKSQKAEILFLERCWEFLKKGTGKLAIVLPDGILTNTTLEYVREFAQENFEIEGIFSLPQVTFAHYGAGLKSSVLLLRKREKNETVTDHKVFCALVNQVGYDRTGRKDRNDLPTIVNQFKDYKAGKELYTRSVFVKKEVNSIGID